MKQTAGVLLLLLTTCVVNANPTTLAVKSLSDSNNTDVLSFSVNNQSNDTIHTDSTLIPAEAKSIVSQDAVIFSASLPQNTTIQWVRYTNGNYGCDFYFDRVDQSISEGYSNWVTYITAVGINSASSCNVFTAGSVNHLSVSFFDPSH